MIWHILEVTSVVLLHMACLAFIVEFPKLPIYTNQVALLFQNWGFLAWSKFEVGTVATGGTHHYMLFKVYQELSSQSTVFVVP